MCQTPKLVKRLLPVLFFFVFLNQILIASPHEIDMNGPNSPDISILQVKQAIQKKHTGKITAIEKKATANHPNCHIVKMKTATNGLKYIRYACN